MRHFDRAAAIDPPQELYAQRLRGDVAALRRTAADTMTRRLELFDAEIGLALADVGLTGEAVEVYRRAGLAEVLSPNSG